MLCGPYLYSWWLWRHVEVAQIARLVHAPCLVLKVPLFRTGLASLTVAGHFAVLRVFRFLFTRPLMSRVAPVAAGRFPGLVRELPRFTLVLCMYHVQDT